MQTDLTPDLRLACGQFACRYARCWSRLRDTPTISQRWNVARLVKQPLRPQSEVHDSELEPVFLEFSWNNQFAIDRPRYGQY